MNLAPSLRSPGERFEASVVIPAHNARATVLDAIESALQQTLPPAEVVVVDDGSSDGTAEAIAMRFGAEPALRVVRGRFGSAAAARNAGWRAATRPWIALLDADDVWFPDKLATAANTLESFPRAGWFFSDGAFQDIEGEEWRSWFAAYARLQDTYVGHPVAQLLEVNFVLTSSVVMRRALLESLGGFDAGLSHAEDIDLWIRLARRAPAAAVARPLLRYHRRADGLSNQIERRLMGDVHLFERLGRDPELSASLRRRARRRVALANYKMAFNALRAGDRRGLWSRLPRAWSFPDRVVPVLVLATAGALPHAWVKRFGERRRMTHAVAGRALVMTPVELQSDPALLADVAGGGAP